MRIDSVLVLMGALVLGGCASKDISSNPYPAPLKKKVDVKVGTLFVENFSMAHQEGNYDKQYLDRGTDIKFYWVAEPKWEVGAPESVQPKSFKKEDLDFAARHPWIQSRKTTNYPIAAIQKRVRTQQFFMMNLKTWNVCFLSRLNIKQSAYSKERYDVSKEKEDELKQSQAFSVNSTTATGVTCDNWDKLPAIEGQH